MTGVPLPSQLSKSGTWKKGWKALAKGRQGKMGQGGLEMKAKFGNMKLK